MYAELVKASKCTSRCAQSEVQRLQTPAAAREPNSVRYSELVNL
jgi:hypothetical protein